MKRFYIPFLFLCFLITEAWGQASHMYQPLAPERIESKNYYFTFLTGYVPEVDSLLQTNAVLKQMAETKQQQLKKAITFDEQIAAFKLSDDEIERAGNALSSLYAPENALGRLLTGHILPSGCYGQYKETGKELIKRIWEQDAKGMNHAIAVYGAGARPNYPMIDSIYFDVTSSRYRKEILPTCVQNVALENEASPRFYSVTLLAAKHLLDVNDRLQAADYEPMGATVNQAAYRRVRQINWKDYPYSALIVLGVGPNVEKEAISPEGRQRAAYAALCFRRHLIPFIILSGGKVHPYHTPYCEAEEMKKYMMEVWNVPAEAIIMEPHARHTTTNVRNAGRILWREGFPTDKPALITGSTSHIDYVINPNFKKRFLKELKIVPYRLGKRVSERLVEYYPLESALIINPSEPMDP